MRAFVSHDLNGIDSLAIEELPDPDPLGPGQVRVAMRAASVNFRDIVVLSGMMRALTVPDLIPCSDGAGEVVETAPDVWRVRVGDRVVLTFNPDWIDGRWTPSPGALGRGGGSQGVVCEQVVVHQNELVAIPPHLDYIEAATLPCAAVTAWHALFVEGGLLPGGSILLQGGGGVSLFALQFALMAGQLVIMTSSSPERCEALRRMGATETIDRTADPDWSRRVRDLTYGQGVDLVVDIGGAATIGESLKAARTDGRVALVGMLTGMPEAATTLFSSGARVSVEKVGSRADLEALTKAMAVAGAKPVIDGVHAFEELPDALRRLQSGQQLGKIAVRIG